MLTKADAIAELKRRKEASEKMLPFTVKTKPDYDVNWHHRVLCEHLDRFIAGDIKRLMVFMPPRHGKSELVSRRLPAFILGKVPNAKIIAASYSADLARLMNRDVQRIIDSPRYQAIFPKTRLNAANIRANVQGNWLRNSDIFEIVEHGGTYRACGIGGGITGMGADYAIIDDPIKNAMEAHSETFRKNTWEWYQSTLYTRMEKNDAILITLTRWHQDDLAGRLLGLQAKEPNADQWTVINFPAIKETTDNLLDERGIGEALWPNKYNVKKLNSIKSTSQEYVWNALYQGNPHPLGGGLFKQDWWRTYRDIPRFRIRVIQVWDTAFKEKETNDYSACETWLESDMGYHLLDAYRDRLNYPNLIKQMKAQYAKHKPDVVIVEDKASGQSAVQTLQAETKMPILARPAERDLIARASTVSAAVEAGNCFIPEYAEWLADWLGEHNAFPGAPHDDWVSCTILFLEFVKQAIGDYAEEFDIGESVVNGYDGDSY